VTDLIASRYALEFNPYYSSNLLKMNAYTGYPDLVETNFGQLDCLLTLVAVGDSNYSDE